MTYWNSGEFSDFARKRKIRNFVPASASNGEEFCLGQFFIKGDVWLAGCVELISVRLQIINTYFYTVKLLFQKLILQKNGFLI